MLAVAFCGGRIKKVKMRYKALRRGTTIITPTTKKWSKEEMERNEETESRMIFTDFSFEDTGKSRQLVCTMNVNHPDYREYRKLIEYAPSLLNELKAMVNLFDRDLPEGSIGIKACDDAKFLIRELSA